jgi:aminopeptidase N
MPARRLLLTGLCLGLVAAFVLTDVNYAGASVLNDSATGHPAILGGTGHPHQLGCSRARSAVLRDLAEGEKNEDDLGTRAMRESFGDTDVLHYNLDIEVFPATQEIAGANTMTVGSLVDGLTEFTFRLHANFTITAAVINGTTPVTITDISTTTRVATLDRAYDVGETFALAITYEGTPVAEGFGSLWFRHHNGIDVVSSLSCPYYAYTWWPCKDGDVGEPGDNGDKATTELAVTAPDDLRTVSNGLLQGVDTLPGNRTRYRWATDYPIATYLVMFSTTNYTTWTADYDYGSGTMPVEFNLYPEDDTPDVRESLEQCLVMLDTFRRLFGPYPFLNEKYGIYEFEFGGGMEHQTNTGQGSFEGWLTAHELSHQWWGDAVTCRTWHDVWLNEGFATYSEALWREHRPGSPGESALHYWMSRRRPGRVDDSVYCYDTSSLWRIFDNNFSYRKAAWVLHQLRHIVGDDTFFHILAEYRGAFEGSAATTEDFIAIAETVAGRDLRWFFDEWVYEIGAPAYRYGWQAEQINGQDYLRLHINQVQDPSWGTFIMPLDVCVDYDGGSETYVIFNDASPEHFVIAIPGPASDVVVDQFDWVLHTTCYGEPYLPGPPVIVQADPLPGESVPPSTAPTQLTITFSEEVSCSATDFAVEEATARPVDFTVDYASGNYTATLNFNEPLPLGTYTITVRDSIQSANGIALDGEISDPTNPQSLPSGEGLPGGDAVFTFFVRCPGDLDGDLDVDRDDVELLLLHYGMTGGMSYEDGDLDLDADVDLADLAALLSVYGTSCG